MEELSTKGQTMLKTVLENATRDMFCGLTQLLFGSQCVEAGLRDDLTEELQQHVVVGGLHVCLIVDLNAAVVVHFIPLLVNIPAT